MNTKYISAVAPIRDITLEILVKEYEINVNIIIVTTPQILFLNIRNVYILCICKQTPSIDKHFYRWSTNKIK